MAIPQNSTWPPSRKRLAFTLLEGVFAVFLIGLVFGLVADLLFGASKVLRFQANKNQANQAIQFALSRICSEVREAAKIEATGPEVRILKADSSQPNLGASGMDAPANRFRYVVRIRYYTDGQGNLLREVTPVSPAAGAAAVQTLAEGITGLNCAPVYGAVNPLGLNITLSLNDVNAGVRNLSAVVLPLTALGP